MSLSKQLLILISALFLLIFSVNLVLSINNTKAYLEHESQSHAQDTATSLGLSLSPYMKDNQNPTIKAMISAIFDMGYYGEIRLVDINGHELIKLVNHTKVEDVPDWFIDLLPLAPASAKSEISSGWTIKGTVYVSVNPGYAYSSLYQQTKTSFNYSLIALAASMLMLMLVLRITLASLKRIDKLALKIANGCFDTLETLPWTREIRNVALSMNDMSQKIKSTISGLNNKLEMTAEKLLTDELTGLYKKSVFETDIMHLTTEPSISFLQYIKLDSLSELIKDRGNQQIDQLLQAVAALLSRQTSQQPDNFMKAYRLYGGEFALLIKVKSLEQIESICLALSADLAELGKQYDKIDLVHIGVSAINPVDTPESSLIAAQEAYEQARIIGPNSYYIRTDQQIARDVASWKALFDDCIERNHYGLTYSNPIFSFSNGELIMDEAQAQVTDAEGQIVAMGPFISIAEKYAKIVDFDKGVIQQVLAHIRTTGLQHAIAVNLSSRTIKNAAFLAWLKTVLKTQPAGGQQLIFSFSAYAVSKDVAAYVSFFDTLHQWGGRVMIKRFEPQSLLSEINKQLKPDFVRLARDIGNGISHARSKQDFAQTIQDMAALRNIAILAENVQADDDYHTLKTIGLTGASR